ncbi:hypothetical protein ACFV0Z_11480 [Streptomyces xiamenensis]|uniref:hypothetical protein n=1 Tax=Streptomyces xiamenensis TaxID=408015 RepID=UPI00367B7170
MKVKFVGIDPETNGNHCPTVWTDTDSQDILIQGYIADDAHKAACEATSPATATVPDNEMIIRIPARMAPALREACDVIERSAVR